MSRQSTKKKRRKKVDYRYTESGLDNVIIKGVEMVTHEDGTEQVCISKIHELHRAIAHSLITRETGISAKELKFLRSEIGMTQEQLAEILKVNRVTISRWESGKEHIDSNAEFVVRRLAAELLEIDLEMTVEEMAKSCVWKVKVPVIAIDGSNPEKYELLAA